MTECCPECGREVGCFNCRSECSLLSLSIWTFVYRMVINLILVLSFVCFFFVVPAAIRTLNEQKARIELLEEIVDRMAENQGVIIRR